VGVLLAALVLDLLVNLILLALFPRLFLLQNVDAVMVASTPVIVPTAANTPFLPLAPTPSQNTPGSQTDRVSPPETPAPIPTPSSDFYGIDFSPGASPIRIIIQPQLDRVNQGKPITILVRPGISCPYEDHRACISSFLDESMSNIVFASVHSGIGGEAESLRRAVEGMGLNQAAFSLKMIESNLERLAGATVRIKQNERVIEGLRVIGAGRIPAVMLRDYLSRSAVQAVAMAAGVNPDMKKDLQTGLPSLIFETCGWKHPAEPWAPGVTNASGSIYLAVIQLDK